MSDKERLEEMKNGCLEGLHILFGTSLVSMPKENFDWLIEQAEKAEKYREALEFYASRNHYSDRLYDDKIVLLDDGEKARQALEGEE